MLYKHPGLWPGSEMHEAFLKCILYTVFIYKRIYIYIYTKLLYRHINIYIYTIYVYIIYINGMCISQPASKTCERYSGRTCMPTLGARFADIQVMKGKVQMKGTKWNW